MSFVKDALDLGQETFYYRADRSDNTNVERMNSFRQAIYNKSYGFSTDVDHYDTACECFKNICNDFSDDVIESFIVLIAMSSTPMERDSIAQVFEEVDDQRLYKYIHRLLRAAEDYVIEGQNIDYRVMFVLECLLWGCLRFPAEYRRNMNIVTRYYEKCQDLEQVVKVVEEYRTKTEIYCAGVVENVNAVVKTFSKR